MINKPVFGTLKTSTLIISASICLLENPLHADDTELYTAVLNGGFSEQVRPNILYIIDTSGSMDNAFFYDPADWHEAGYNPDIVWPGECDANFIYRHDAEHPAYQTFDTYGYPLEVAGGQEHAFQSCGTPTSKFPKSTFVCDANGDFEQKGWIYGQAGEFRPYSETALNGITMNGNWNAFSGSLSGYSEHLGTPIWRECAEDAGAHGSSDVSGEKFPVNREASDPDTDDGFTSATVGTWTNPITRHYVLADGNFLNWFYAAPRTRIAAVQVALRDVIQALPSDVNVGIMRFDSDAGPGGTDGGMMLKEFVRIGSNNNRQDVIDALFTIPSDQLQGATPLAETMLEAAYVFMGKNAYFGAASENDAGDPFPSVGESRQSAHFPSRYISPITESCQQNHIIYFTDGAPDSDNSAFDGESGADDVSGWNGGIDKFLDIDEFLTPQCNRENGDDSEFCLPVLSAYLFNTDASPSPDGVSGVQTVTTHTIGFDDGVPSGTTPPNPDYLRTTAERGGGTFHMVSSADELRDAFSITTREAVVANTAFTAPALAVNAFNRILSENRVYFAMFKSSISPGWGGNLKAYQFHMDNQGILRIVDADNKPAIHEGSGQFNFDARSIWSEAADGNEVPAGGAANRLPTTRSIYTWLGGANHNLRSSEYEFTTDNPAITSAMLGMNETDPGTLRTDLINWLRGMDVLNEDGDDTTTRRLHMGDPLHSRPSIVTYGASESNPMQRVFITTNDGFLHVIDAATGEETFAFVADETLSNAKRLFMDDTSVSGKVYGLDGVPVLDINEAGTDEPGIVGEDKVYLYTGMRRGGRSYYAFDMTDPDSPEILWRIQGGNADDPFYRLGYTFSTPRTGEIKFNGEPRKILVFGGGYNLGQDEPEGSGSTRDSYRADAYGNAIYIVDALSGTRLWWASASDADLNIPEMTNSIPSDVALVDSDNDGWSDRIYVGDTGGRVFRIDISEVNTDGTIESWGGMIADLGASNVDPVANVQHNRKFFYAPDVSMVENGVNDYLAIAIGSGNRAHPSYPIGTDTATQDVFFVLKDPNILNRPSDYDYGIVFDDDILFDVGANGLVSDDTALNASKGWYLAMTHAGEKILAESTTFDYTVTFTSFEPEDIDLSTCQARTGIGRLYALNLRNGNPVYNFDGDEETTAADRSYVLARDGIPPAPTIAFPDANNGEPLMMAGPEIIPADPGGNLRRSYWMIPESEE